MKIDTGRTNIVREHDWRMLCSVGATGARAAHPLSFLEVSPAPFTLLFQLVVSLDWYGLV